LKCSNCPPSSIQTVARSVSPSPALAVPDPYAEPIRASADTVVSNCQRKSLLRPDAFINSLMLVPSPVLRDANADQFRISQEDIGRKSAVVAVQEIAGDRGRIKDIFVIEHHLPTILVGEDQRDVDVGVPA